MTKKVKEVEKQEGSSLEQAINKCKALNAKIDTEGDALERKVNHLTSLIPSSPQGMMEQSKERLHAQLSSTRSLNSETESLKRLARGGR